MEWNGDRPELGPRPPTTTETSRANVSRNPRIALFVLLMLVVTPTLRALAGPGEGTLVSNINSARSSNGLPPLESHSTLISYSRQHSEEMLASNSIYHSSSGQLTSLVSGWTRIGENVGRGPSASAIFSAFMGSSGHRANILGDFTHMGVGTAEDPDGVLYVTIVFVKLATTTTTTTTTTAPTPTTTAAPTPTTTKPSPATTKPPPTTKPPSTPSSVVTTSSTTTIPELSTEEAVACAVAALGTGSADEMGTTDLVVTTCEGAAAAAASWPEGTEVGAVAGDPGVVILTFTAPTPTTVTTTTTTSTTTSTTAPPTPTTVAPTTIPNLDFSEPAAPGAAELVRVVAGTILGLMALLALVAGFRRRR